MFPSWFVVIGTAISAISGLGYLVSTITGQVHPNRVTFFMWSIAPLISSVAEVEQGGGLLAIQTLSMGVFPLLTLLASLTNPKAEWKLTKFDLLCGALSAVGLILWLITKVGNIAIILSILADGLAALPTILKTYRFPESEVAWPWFTTALGVGVSVLTIKQWTLANYGFLVYSFAVVLLIALLAKFRPCSPRVAQRDYSKKTILRGGLMKPFR